MNWKLIKRRVARDYVTLFRKVTTENAHPLEIFAAAILASAIGALLWAYGGQSLALRILGGVMILSGLAGSLLTFNPDD
jgi:hypothetical protein